MTSHGIVLLALASRTLPPGSNSGSSRTSGESGGSRQSAGISSRSPGLERTQATHYRAHLRKPVRLQAEIVALRVVEEHIVSRIVDLGLGGAGLEMNAPLTQGERLRVTLSAPTMWDPLVIDAVVAWTHPASRPPSEAVTSEPIRAGVAFDYATPSAVLALFKMLATLARE